MKSLVSSRAAMARLLVGLTLLLSLPVGSIEATTRVRNTRLTPAASPRTQDAKPPSPAREDKGERETQTTIEAEPAGPLADDGRGPNAVAVTPGSATVFLEAEPNNAAATANALPSNYVRATGNIQPPAESDFYAFTATAGDRVYAATQTLFGSQSNTGGLSADSILTLLDTDGTTVLETDDDDGTFGSTSSTIAGRIVPTTGTYYLRVQGFSATSEISPYDLYLRVLTGSPTAETEPNNNNGVDPPNPLPANGWMSGVVGVVGDSDVFSLSLNAGETVFLSLDLDPERNATTFNGRMLFGPYDGFVLPVNDASIVSPNSEAGFFTVQNAGNYFVIVDATAGAGAAATYNLAVSVIPPNVTRTCTTFSTSPASTIGPGASLTQSSITIPAAPVRRIGNLAVALNITHAAVSDLDISLVGPDGDEVVLFDDAPNAAAGSTVPQIDCIVDDEAGIPITSFNVYKGVRGTPEGQGRLAWFRGELAAGTWTLNVRDDLAANGGTLNSWSLIVCEDPPVPACASPTTVFSNDFEVDDGGFTHNGTLDEWELGTPSGAPISTANSGVRAWETDLDNTYENSSNQNLVSPTISLAPYTGQTISFEWAMKHQIESSAFDNAFVEVREVGGAMAIKRVWEWSGPTQQRTGSVGNPAVTVQSASGWAEYRADITQFAGLNVQLVFHLDTDSSVPFDGMGIDDVRVTACPAAAPDVAITKSGPASVPCDSMITYTLTASNIGTAAATNAMVADDLPDCLTSVMVSSTSGTFGVGAGNVVTGTIPTLSPGSPVTITITAIVPSGCGASIMNQATIAATGDTTPANNMSAVVTTSILPVSSCSLSPATDTNPILTAHTVTATVTLCGVVQSGAAVTLSVTGRNTLNSSGNTNGAGQISFTYTDTGSAFIGGSDTITLTVVSSGSTCTATKDWIATTCVITCPANVTQPNDANQCGAVVTYPAPTSTGDCGTITCSPASGSFFPVGTTTVTCTSQAMTSCTFSVTVQDTQAPAITCPANITVPKTPGQCDTTVSYTVPTPTDNCPGATASCTPASGSTFPVGVTTVTCTAVDASPNSPDATCTFTITVTDTTAPTITCPANISQPAAAGQCSAAVTYVTPTPTDNCPGTTVVCAPASGSTFPVGTTTVTCTATDASSNSSMCTFTVTVNDTQVPTANCPAPIVTGTATGMCAAVVNYTATASDNCPGATVACVPASGSSFPVGTTTVTCTATDASGNTGACSFTVTVNDTQVPVITCPANVVVTGGTGTGCTFSTVVNYPAPTATDNCGVGSVVCVPPSGSTFAEGTTTVTCTATDTTGNTASCSFTVTVGAGFGFCAVDDLTGDRFQMVVNPASPSFGSWRYTVVATNVVYCGKANSVNYVPGVRLIAYDNDYSAENPTYFMNANFKGNSGTVTMRNVSGTVRKTLRDRNLLDSVCP